MLNYPYQSFFQDFGQGGSKWDVTEYWGAEWYNPPGSKAYGKLGDPGIIIGSGYSSGLEHMMSTSTDYYWTESQYTIIYYQYTEILELRNFEDFVFT